MSDLNPHEEGLAVDLARAQARIEELIEERDRWKDRYCFMSGEMDTVLAGREDEYDRAQTAEAKLAKAVEALKIDPWFIGYGGWKKHVKDTLTELTGGKDE